jgi:hypothetical protein
VHPTPTLFLKDKGYVVMETNVDFTTNGGDVILWGNTVNTSSGTANNEVDLRGTNNVSTSGGKDCFSRWFRF